jgi:hypothetical protein
MINGNMAEAQRGFAVLDDVDEGTIQRFVEWAYKGYYTAADIHLEISRPSSPLSRTEDTRTSTGSAPEPPQVFPDEAEKVPVEVGAPLIPETVAEVLVEDAPSAALLNTDHVWGLCHGRTLKKVKPGKTSRELMEAFLQRDYKFRSSNIILPPPRGDPGPKKDYTEVFLSHARLYVFAEMYDIQVLKTLAYEELHHALCNYMFSKSGTGAIIALFRYVYANTSCGGGGGDLRKLLTDYIGCQLMVLMRDTTFKDLMIEDGGELLGDFMKMVAIRIYR